MYLNFTKILVAALALCLSPWLMAQPGTCDGSRYLDEIFVPSGPTTVKFGENNTNGGNFQELRMDIYEPEGDVAAMRPAIVLAFGGSFISGTRQSMASICQLYASKGYVAVTIDYRLYDKPIFPLPDSLDMMEEVLMAVADMKAAVRFLRKDAMTDNNYRINPDFIAVGGVSAGGIVAVHSAYARDISEVEPHVETILNGMGGIEGDTDDPMNSSVAYSSEAQAVVNFYGALYRKSYISPEDPPIVSIHGTADPIVPYGFGNATVFSIPIISMEGSGAMHPYATTQGVWNHLISVPNGGHGEFMSDQMWADSMYNMSSLMLEQTYCNLPSSVSELEDVSGFVVAAPNPSAGDMRIGLNGLNESFDLLVFDNAGRLVKSYFKVQDDVIVLSKSDFPPGFYHASLRFHDESLAPVVKKLVFGR